MPDTLRLAGALLLLEAAKVVACIAIALLVALALVGFYRLLGGDGQ